MVVIKRKNLSESYNTLPRVNSTHNRFVFDALAELSSQIDFRHPSLRDKPMRSHSIGSAQALVVEIALQNEDVLNTIRKYLINGGKDWYPILHYRHKY